MILIRLKLGFVQISIISAMLELLNNLQVDDFFVLLTISGFGYSSYRFDQPLKNVKKAFTVINTEKRNSVSVPIKF